MKVGDLVLKYRGYGSEEQWTGIILGFISKGDFRDKVEVLSIDGIESWNIKMVKLVHENR